MSLHTVREQMSEREREEFQQEKEAAAIQGNYNLEIKKMDLEIAREEAKWTNVLRLPIAIITIPVKLLMALGYLVAVAKKTEPSKEYWDFLRK